MHNIDSLLLRHSHHSHILGFFVTNNTLRAVYSFMGLELGAALYSDKISLFEERYKTMEIATITVRSEIGIELEVGNAIP